jgi:(2S)-methylsuccinyl-CoA dehydrogenase
MPTSALPSAVQAVEVAGAVVHEGSKRLATLAAANGSVSPAALDAHQLLSYDVAHAASAVEACRAMLPYGDRGPMESMLTCVYVADAVAALGASLLGRETVWQVPVGTLDVVMPFVEAYRSPEFLERLADELPVAGTGPTHLSEDLELARDSFRRFAVKRIAPLAERVHRADADIPEEIITGLGELGAFGLSIPERYGGYASGDESDYLGMVVVTEELSRASLGIGGSLITRPEILSRAILVGGTEEQRHRWLPRIASGELMVGVMVTEPDHGSDVAGIRTTATPVPGGYRVSGTKTWATFAGRANLLMVLARTSSDRSLGHRGLSVLVVEKEPSAGHAFVLQQPEGGKLEGRAIDTIGYRGMHSFEVSFADWFVPAENVVGGVEGLGRGFYLQMEGFESGRLQTAARAVGVMQAAFEAALAYTQQRQAFGRPIFKFQLTKAKLARMAALVQAGRQFAYEVAKRMGRGDGTLEASMVKASVCRSAEWVTREAMQLHGGMGYAEESPVSRYFVDARVLSIFEGTDETLCLRLISRRLAEVTLKNATEA